MITNIKRLFLFLLLSFSSIGLMAQISATERAALIALYNSTNGASWTNQVGMIGTAWNDPLTGISGTAGSECSWFGITCDVSELNVILINLANNNLVGNLPPELNDLTALDGLNLPTNQLTGTIPDLSNLTNFVFLDLNGNQLTGGIPAYINTFTGLQVLNLGNNLLTVGAIPDLSSLTSLTTLDLNHAQITGSIPAYFNTFINLETLNLNNNQLTGAIPDLSSLSGLLITFDLSLNQLSGSIPSYLSSFTSLNNMLLNNNQLTGGIPDLSSLTLLNRLWLQENLLSAVVDETTLPSSLSEIRLHRNQCLTPFSTTTEITIISKKLPADPDPFITQNCSAPIAVSDNPAAINPIPITIDVVANDTLGGLIDPASVDLDLSQIGINNSFSVANEGDWTVDNTGKVTFTPLAGFTHDPSPISYTVDNQESLAITSDSTQIQIDYLPITIDDVSNNNTVGSTVTFNITANDITGDIVDINTVDLDLITTGQQLNLAVPNQGTWSAIAFSPATDASIVFIPDATFTGGSASISYKIKDLQGNESNASTATVNFVVSLPDVIGQTRLAATATLQGLGLTVNIIFAMDANVLANDVISQNPIAGTSVAVGSAVDLVISSGTIATPTANNDEGNGFFGQSVTLPILANDFDATGTSNSGLGRSTVILNGDASSPYSVVTSDGDWFFDINSGNLTYTPNSTSFLTSVSVNYTVAESTGIRSNSAVVSIDYLSQIITQPPVITPPVAVIPPVAVDDNASADAGATVSITVISNDSDSDGEINPNSIALAGKPVGESLVVAGQGVWSTSTGVITFTPAAGVTNSPSSITYTVEDNAGNTSNAATVAVNYKAVIPQDDGIAFIDTNNVLNIPAVQTRNGFFSATLTPVDNLDQQNAAFWRLSNGLPLNTPNPIIKTVLSRSDGSLRFTPLRRFNANGTIASEQNAVFSFYFSHPDTGSVYWKDDANSGRVVINKVFNAKKAQCTVNSADVAWVDQQQKLHIPAVSLPAGYYAGVFESVINPQNSQQPFWHLIEATALPENTVANCNVFNPIDFNIGLSRLKKINQDGSVVYLTDQQLNFMFIDPTNNQLYWQ